MFEIKLLDSDSSREMPYSNWPWRDIIQKKGINDNILTIDTMFGHTNKEVFISAHWCGVQKGAQESIEHLNTILAGQILEIRVYSHYVNNKKVKLSDFESVKCYVSIPLNILAKHKNVYRLTIITNLGGIAINLKDSRYTMNFHCTADTDNSEIAKVIISMFRFNNISEIYDDKNLLELEELLVDNLVKAKKE